ncbi:MAG: multiheme c-type cytochrome [Planctomycetota bacterium]|nr:multiheme c-type cytochrome [Planctomycetota bacterium]
MDEKHYDQKRPGAVSLPPRRVLAGLVLAVCCIWRVSSQPADLADARLDFWLPFRDAVEIPIGLADESGCVECHEQAESFSLTGHARTLTRATHPDSLAALRQLKQTASALAEGLRVELPSEETSSNAVRVTQSSGEEARSELKLDWCFGSGEHARTWVGTLNDSWGATDLVEFRWTHFHATGGFDVTPGQVDSPPPGYFQGLGVLYDAPKARSCFACHATSLTVSEGRLDAASLKPGVTCQRCHGSRQAHVDSEGKVGDSFWRTATQLESVNRCGQCHRRADEQEPDTITTDNVDIVRFQPVGLVQSACFRGSPQMTCMTCHDPHRPLSAQDSLGIRQCVQCHDGAEGHDPFCGAGHRDDCLRCHMPKIQSRRPVEFTDHWIRIRRPDEIPPAASLPVKPAPSSEKAK